ncbi:MAG: UvrD-helicase domain-containing protein, partial [Flavobacteriales bacterium]
MSRSKAFLVLKASAGSGKTYALVKNYLQLCLAQKSPAYYRHILAITFTNAAAAEMKERVIGWLHHLAVSKPADLESDHRALDLTSALDIPIHELQARAASVLSHMVHHYDLLAITTIDSFTHR